jgi:hypothetical protein
MTKKKTNPIPKVGNKNALKLKTPELKKEAYRQYCSWIASGKSKDGWKFHNSEISLTSKTMEKYIRENPDDFPSIHKEMAEADSFAFWEEIGIKMMLGQVEKPSPAVYQMFMRNKFGWDKETHTSSTSETDVRRLLARWEVGKNDETES